MALPEFGHKFILGDNVLGRCDSFHRLPPSPCWSGKKVSCIKDSITSRDSGNNQIVLDSAKLVTRIKGFSDLGKHGWIGVLEVLQL